jgi:nucleotide-binding universal stress UspA family protein
MKSFKRILFLADGSKGEKAVLARAAKLAATNKAKLTIFDVLDTEGYTERGSAESLYGELLERFLKERVEARREQLESLMKSEARKHSDLKIMVRVETGSKARTTIRAVLVDRYDLVVKAAEGGDAMRYLFGSTDRALMRKCPCPVWILKPTRKRRFRKILAAVDVNPVEPKTESLAERVVSLATALAKEERAELHVLHAWRLAGEYKMRGRQIYASKVDEIVRQLREAHRKELDTVLRRHPYEPRIVHLVKGRAASLIPQAVEELDIDLVVMGTVGRTGVPGLVIGNTAESVLGSVDCSVLTLKPEGFESPIKP